MIGSYSHNEKQLDVIVQAIHIFSKNIEKCAVLVIENGTILKSFGIDLPDGKVIKSLQEGATYKYLKILEADRCLGEEMKLKVSEEYFRRLEKFFEVKIK